MNRNPCTTALPALRVSTRSRCGGGSNLEADVAIAHALDHVVSNRSRKARPGFDPGCLLSEHEASQFVPQSLYLVWIFGRPKAARQFEKRPLFLLAGLNSQFNELDQNSVVAQALAIRDMLDLFGHGRGKGYASADKIV